MGARLVAGVDSSTQSCKIVVLDAETGEEQRSSSSPHPDGTAVDPRRWWEALRAAGEEVGLDDAAAVGVAGQQHGMVALDGDGDPVHDALLWNDTRSAEQARSLRDHWGSDWWAQEIGSVPVASFTVTKLAWLAQTHPELAQRVDRVLLPHDYLTWRLLGRPERAITDASDASGTGYWSVPQGAYRDDVLSEAFGRTPRLPAVIASSEVAGEGAEEPAKGAIVSAGCGDNAGAALGLGLEHGEVAVSVGTSGTAFTATTTVIADPTGGIAGFADATGGSLPLVATLNCARVLSDTARLLGVDLQELERLAGAAAPDAAGLVLVPFFDGERTPDLPSASASLLGVTRDAWTPDNVARAAFLAVALSLEHALGLLRAEDLPVDRVVVTGGAARSAVLLDVAAALWRADVEAPEPAEYVARGAARQATWALSGDDGPPSWPRAAQRRVDRTEPGWADDVRGRYADALRQVYGI